MASVYKMNGRKNWMIAHYDAGGTRRVRSSGTTDRRLAERVAAKLDGDALLRREGVVDPTLDAFAAAARKPIQEHLGDFVACLRHRGRTEKHAKDREAQLGRLVETSGATSIGDLTPGRVQRALAELKKRRNLSLRTLHRHVVAVKALSRWLVREGRLPTDHLANLTGYNCDLDRRHERRALTATEAATLVAAAENGPEVERLSGRDRAALYRLAVGTGFRTAELASLTPESFGLDDEPPRVTVKAGYTKNGKLAIQPIRRDLAQILRPWLAGKPAGAPVFDVPKLSYRTARMMRHDLAVARIAYRDADGLFADFHALRHTFITEIVRSGANVKAAQTLARHSTPVLTLAVYAHMGMEDLGEALEAMPPAPSARPAVANATNR